MTGSITATNCRRSNLVSLFLEEAGTIVRFSVGERTSVCLCVCAGETGSLQKCLRVPRTAAYCGPWR